MYYYNLSKIKFALPLFLSITLSLSISGCSNKTSQGPDVAEAATLPDITVSPTIATATDTTLPPTETSLPTETLVLPTETPTPVPPTETPSPTTLPSEIVDDLGVTMVLVPAGEFIMGSDNNQAVAAPAHKVYLDTFYIDKYEVTNELYRACADAEVCTTGGGILLRREDTTQHPVMDVTWYDAQRYCEWRGGNLPTEAQWEKAARGTDERIYPWGNDPVTCSLARYGECGWMTVPIGRQPLGASPYGAEDMAGNAWEWVYDWYQDDYYYESPYENPTGPTEETGWKSERGGAWFYEGTLMTAIWRNQAPPSAHYLYVGFRCAKTP